MINVLFFAQFRERLGCSEMTLSLDDMTTVSDLVDLLAQKSGHWSDIFSSDQWLVAVNQSITDGKAKLAKGDEIAFFPPVTGG